MMKRAFTLIELLVVIGIMGILGTASVGGYRAMSRGMEEKGVMQDVNSLVRAAYQRAQVDRQPTAIFFWNETIRAATADDNEIVVGHAVAVRRSGRLTKVEGMNLYDEFADLNLLYPTDDGTSSSSGGSNNKGASGSSSSDSDAWYLYPMDRISASNTQINRSLVAGTAYGKQMTLMYLTDLTKKDKDSGNLTVYGFRMIDQGGVSWQPGMAYGFEFANIELPHGYIFESNYKKDVNNPIQEAGVMIFDVGYNNGNGVGGGDDGMGSRTSVNVYALQPGADGSLQAKLVGKSEKPTDQMN